MLKTMYCWNLLMNRQGMHLQKKPILRSRHSNLKAWLKAPTETKLPIPDAYPAQQVAAWKQRTQLPIFRCKERRSAWRKKVTVASTCWQLWRPLLQQTKPKLCPQTAEACNSEIWYRQMCNTTLCRWQIAKLHTINHQPISSSILWVFGWYTLVEDEAQKRVKIGLHPAL